MDFSSPTVAAQSCHVGPEQKYYDYFTDKTGFYTFSPLYGLSAGSSRRRGILSPPRVACVEYALSPRRASSSLRQCPTTSREQARAAKSARLTLAVSNSLGLDGLLQGRSPVLQALADRQADKATPRGSPQTERRLLRFARSRQRHARSTRHRRRPRSGLCNAAKLNLYPAPPDMMVTVDREGQAPGALSFVWSAS